MNKKSKFPWSFLILAYALAWMFWIPVALTGKDYQKSPLLLLAVMLGVFGPGIAGILLTYREADREKRRDFWRRALDLRRIRTYWIPIILLFFPALHLLANFSGKVLSGETPVSALVKQMAAQPAMILVVILLYFLQAGLEDLGWRGYMLERLLKNWTPVKSALLVGIFHSFWHLPMFWVVGTNQIKMGFGFDFGLFIAQAVAFSIYASWCYVDNSHSTLAAILLHTTGNLSNDIFTLEAGTMSYQVYTLLMVVGAIIISLVWLKRASNHPCISQA